MRTSGEVAGQPFAEKPDAAVDEERQGAVDEELEELRRRFDSAHARFERQHQSHERKARRDLYQREMGLGYLIYTARQYRRMSQGTLARRLGTSRCVFPRWESGGRLPSLLTLEKIAAATDLELLIGLRDPNHRDDDLIALGIVFDEGNLTELLMLIDKNRDQLRPTPWRVRMAEKDPHHADLLL
jgi:transcriptional regulator with XRE-family HTH domain